VNGVEHVQVDLHEVVVRAASAARRVGTSNDVTVSWSVAEDVHVEGDEARLSQVVDNLFTNAVKYSRPGDTVTASLSVEDDQAVVVVSDTGIGIEPESVDRLFQRFYRSEEARRLGIPGVGLGLSISKDIVEAHGGSIAVTSELAKGSRFEVRLPLVREPESLLGRVGGQ
jgi:signal transduction histidine kinase